MTALFVLAATLVGMGAAALALTVAMLIWEITRGDD